MADLTITLTALQIARVKTAFGSRDEDGNWVDATQGEVEASIRKDHLLKRVKIHEARIEGIIATTTVAELLAAEG